MRCLTIFLIPPSSSSPKLEAPVGLEVHNVSVRFGGLEALSDVTLSATEGAITGLIGPNGAGKTTLFNVVTGMQRPNAGGVSLDGRDLRGLSSYRRARLGLGRTFQRLELFGTLTVAENIGVAASIAQRRAVKVRTRGAREVREQLLERLGLTKLADDRADTLPTGSARIVELARALAIGPRVLLLDEPASGQNEEETAHFGRLLRSLANDGLAILLVEHDMELVMNLCDDIAVLDYGRIICTGSPAEVQTSPEVQAAYLGTVPEPASDA
jgi:branched-chain amino acid transport system ATP-binding protein